MACFAPCVPSLTPFFERLNKMRAILHLFPCLYRPYLLLLFVFGSLFVMNIDRCGTNIPLFLPCTCYTSLLGFLPAVVTETFASFHKVEVKVYRSAAQCISAKNNVVTRRGGWTERFAIPLARDHRVNYVTPTKTRGKEQRPLRVTNHGPVKPTRGLSLNSQHVSPSCSSFGQNKANSQFSNGPNTFWTALVSPFILSSTSFFKMWKKIAAID